MGIGTVDILSALGQQYLSRYGLRTPFLHVSPCHYYEDLKEVQTVVKKLGEHLRTQPLQAGGPLVFTVTGDGFVSRGVLEILKLLPHRVIHNIVVVFVCWFIFYYFIDRWLILKN